MTTDAWFNDLPVIGKLPPEEAAAKLREVGEEEAAAAIENAQRGESTSSQKFAGWWPFDRACKHTAHTFGYIAPASPGKKTLPIQNAVNIKADDTLKNSRIKITLDCLRVADYPGSGTHRVLFDFYAQNQIPGNVEHLHFNATYRIREGQSAAIVGFPIFVGLNVGTEGVAFKCLTVNVLNEEDEAALSFLESDVFKGGLKLASTVQPAIAPLSAMAKGLTETIAKRKKNVPVQDFYLGLDFSNITTRARLAEGSYIAVQIPESIKLAWDWDEWVYDPSSGQVVNDYYRTELIPYNYIIFSVSRYEES
jgi:hypothetical protein